MGLKAEWRMACCSFNGMKIYRKPRIRFKETNYYSNTCSCGCSIKMMEFRGFEEAGKENGWVIDLGICECGRIFYTRPNKL